MRGISSAIIGDQMTLRRLRLAGGLIMLSYLAAHLVMHALGNISWQAMEAGARIHDFVWHSKIGTIALYSAFAVHFSLALWALYARDSLRMGAGEWARLILGFSILPLLIHHFAAGRYVYSAFDVQRSYDVVLTVYFKFFPFWGWRQIAALLVAWTHGCLGLHFWLRPRAWYGRVAPALLAIATLLPAVSLLGIWQGTREVIAHGQAHPDWFRALIQQGHLRDAAVNGPSWTLEVQLYWAFAILVALVLAARFARHLIQWRRGTIRIEYADGKTVRVPKGWAVLDASRLAGISHASICGGRGRCTTCRVRVMRGVDLLPPPEPSELQALARLQAGPNVRLGCQLRPHGDVSVLPLLPVGAVDDETRRRAAQIRDAERTVAIFFLDIRRSTSLVERRLPYDVVFLLNHFFAAVASAVVESGGTPNQFLGDGMMAIFGTDTDPSEACRQSLRAAKLIGERLDAMNKRLAHELNEPISIGIGLHVGRVILGEIGYRDHRSLTAVGDSVHVAARLQDLTKDYKCAMVASDRLLATAAVDASALAAHEIRVRGREGALVIRIVERLEDIAVDAAPVTAAPPHRPAWGAQSPSFSET